MNNELHLHNILDECFRLRMREMVSPERYVSSSLQNGLNREFQNLLKDLLTLSDKFTKPRSSLARKDPSPFTAAQVLGEQASL